MPPPRKPQTAQSTTLLTFFTNKPTCEKENSTRACSSRHIRVKGKRTAAGTQEVIIIDSDDDSDSEGKAHVDYPPGLTKGVTPPEKLDGHDSDIEILDDPPPAFSSPTKTRDDAKACWTSPEQPTSCSASSSRNKLVEKFSLYDIEVNDDFKNETKDEWFEMDLEEGFTPTGALESPLGKCAPGITEANPSKGSNNAFSAIMGFNREDQAWKEASVAEKKGWGRQPPNTRRSAPFYKVLQGFPIAVDAFKYGSIPGVTAYFLTHAHSDHYTHLSSKWDHGPIYCSAETADLIVHMLRVDRIWIRPLPMDVPYLIPDSGGVTVTLIDANHCPGSCLFFFEGPQTSHAGDSNFKSHSVGTKRIYRYLHCGDFRASPKHVHHPVIEGKKIDIIYLDTTYLDPKYTFPSQPEVISACADLAKQLVHGHVPKSPGTLTMSSFFSVDTVTKAKASGDKPKGNILFVVGTYSIGKERILKAVALALKSKVYCDARKTSILRCLNDSELHDMLTTDPLSANVHLVPLSVIASDKLKVYLERFDGHFSKVVGFRPTGWTYAQSNGANPNPTVESVIAKCQQRRYTHQDIQLTRNSSATVWLYGVPYSEHSSFFELSCFSISLEWDKIIATVNVGSEKSRASMKKWFEKWASERRKLRGELKERHPDYW